MSQTNSPQRPRDDADIRWASAGKRQVNDMANDRDAELEAVRRAIESGTNNSFKRTLNACLLMLVARRRIKLVSVGSLAGGAALAHYWHGFISLLVQLVHR